MSKKLIINLGIFLAILLVGTIIYTIKYGPIKANHYEAPHPATQNDINSFAEAVSCSECHADIYRTHLQTAHFNTSKLADSTSIKGSFKEGSNILDLKDVIFTMQDENGIFYQHTNIKNRNITIPDNKFDIVVGSGVRGQTYLTWKDDELFQLHASYHTQSDSWINSIGYPEYFTERPVRDACIKCHVTFAENKGSIKGNQYEKERILFGVDCQKCHGPAQKHVDYQRVTRAETAQFIVKFDTLSRQQRLDVCAQCHSGLRTTVKGNPFLFLPGQNLEEYSKGTAPENDIELDVHGNQYGLLIQSECFKQTPKMDCTTCHNPHEKQRGNTNYFNMQCIGCHSEKTMGCSSNTSKPDMMSQNCISCHMPVSPSKTMTAQLGKDGIETPFNIRTHLIAIYSHTKQ
ncbi:multiheme c-type cytochrome [Maribacter chungangensis]|uniref:Multiheme c-type cytochrome n=1 Tax=Maribacter chungangensis TaxID=1069117 RepID=A0ABW3B3P8_9FLAO